MRRFYLIVMFLAFLLQLSFFPMISQNQLTPNLILIVAIIAGIKKSWLESIIWFLGAGLLFELFSTEFFGFNLVIFILVGGVAWLLSNVIINKEENFFTKILFWFFVKIVLDLTYLLGFIFKDLFMKISISQFFIFSIYLKATLIFVLSGLFLSFLRDFWSIKMRNK